MSLAENPTDLSEAAVPLKAAYKNLTPIDTSEHPERKLLRRGPGALTNTELLAVIAGSGRKPERMIRLAGGILRRHSLEGLARMALRDWLSVQGLGKQRVIRLAAALELYRRLRRKDEEDAPMISGPMDAYRQVRELGRARKEHLVALYLDAQNRLLAKETVSVGGLNTTRTHPREVFQPAIVHGAMGFVLVHNHPSGSLTPSQEDIDFTRAIRRASEILGVGCYDHLIVAGSGYVSLKERGLL